MRSGVFPWMNYCPLLELAHRRGYGLLALNSFAKKGSRASDIKELRRREQVAARTIVKARRLNPGTLFYVIFGDLHLASEFLPAAVLSEWTKLGRHRHCEPSPLQLRTITIFLNAERTYFQLARRGLENAVDVVRFSKDRFCVISSPPWVQWQSYLLFLDQLPHEEFGNRGWRNGF